MFPGHHGGRLGLQISGIGSFTLSLSHWIDEPLLLSTYNFISSILVHPGLKGRLVKPGIL